MKKKSSSNAPSLATATLPLFSAFAMIAATTRFATRPSSSLSKVKFTAPKTATAAAHPPKLSHSSLRPESHRFLTHHAITSAGIIPTANHTQTAGSASASNTRRANASSNAEYPINPTAISSAMRPA